MQAVVVVVVVAAAAAAAAVAAVVAVSEAVVVAAGDLNVHTEMVDSCEQDGEAINQADHYWN